MQPGQQADSTNGFHPVHLSHLDIHEDQARIEPHCHFDRLSATLHADHPKSLENEIVHHTAAFLGVVIDSEDKQTIGRFRRGHQGSGMPSRSLTRLAGDGNRQLLRPGKNDSEPASFSGMAFEQHAASVQLG